MKINDYEISKLSIEELQSLISSLRGKMHVVGGSEKDALAHDYYSARRVLNLRRRQRAEQKAIEIRERMG